MKESKGNEDSDVTRRGGEPQDSLPHTHKKPPQKEKKVAREGATSKTHRTLTDVGFSTVPRNVGLWIWMCDLNERALCSERLGEH